ncbi:MAG: amidohydrolase [Defluviicoccus sp.]|nr:amidohydrolase [Defluviicoccus sp.]MDE0383025.1 amidohydrolase [Defluviicoccus sp.]
MPGALIVKDGLVVRGTAGTRRYETADIVVEGAHIAAVGPDEGREYDGTVVDASNAIVMPGLVNAHLHSNEGFQQGAYDNLPLEIWLGESYPPFGFPILSERDYYLRTMLAAIESIRAGVTTVQDDYVHPPATPDAMDAAIQAYADAGLRAWLTVDMWDQPLRACLPWADELIPEAIHSELASMGGADADAQIALFERQFERWHGHDGRIRIVLAPCGPQRCTPDLLRRIAALSEERDLPIHCHTLETRLQAIHAQQAWGMTAVAFMESMGLLGPRTVLVHAIWLTGDDIARLSGHGCAAVHNPLSNMKLGSGICPLRKLLDAGIEVGLGTDGLATSDTADLVEAIRAASLIHKPGNPDPESWVSADEVFDMATVAGARTGLMAEETGRIEPGMRADLILLDRDHWGFVPLVDPIRQLAFSATSEAVRTSIVDGRVVMRDREILSVDEDALRGEIREAGERYLRDCVPAMEAGARRLAPSLEAIYRRAQATRFAL